MKVLLHFFQREQEMRAADPGPRGAVNMAGMGMIVSTAVEARTRGR